MLHASVEIGVLLHAVASILHYKGLAVRGQGRWPAIDAWFNAMETRETYLGIKSDIYTHVHDLPPQIGGAPNTQHEIEQAEFFCFIPSMDGAVPTRCSISPTHLVLQAACCCRRRRELPRRWTAQTAKAGACRCRP